MKEPKDLFFNLAQSAAYTRWRELTGGWIARSSDPNQAVPGGYKLILAWAGSPALERGYAVIPQNLSNEEADALREQAFRETLGIEAP